MIEFRADFGAEDAVRLAPCKDDKPKDAEIVFFQAGSDCYLSAKQCGIKMLDNTSPYKDNNSKR